MNLKKNELGIGNRELHTLTEFDVKKTREKLLEIENYSISAELEFYDIVMTEG